MGMVDIAALTPDPKNANRHTERGSWMLEDVVGKYGSREAGTLDKNNCIVGGHLRAEVYERLKMREIQIVDADPNVPVFLRFGDLDNDDPTNDAHAIGLALNRVPQISIDLDPDILAELSGDGVPIEDMFTERELDEMGMDFGDEPDEDPGAEIDRAEELREKWGVELGDLWTLGEHKLACESAEQAGINCDFAVYDPPWDWASEKQNEMMGWVNWLNALVAGTSKVFPLAAREDYVGFWVWDQLTGVGISNAALSLPHRSLVMLVYFGDRKRFCADAGLAMLHGAGLAATFISSVPQYVPIVRKYSDGREQHHGGTKPIPLCEYIIALHSFPGDTVGDPFAGSGSFLIAAENLKRKYHGCEIDPKNVAVTLERYQKMFGVTAKRVKRTARNQLTAGLE